MEGKNKMFVRFNNSAAYVEPFELESNGLKVIKKGGYEPRSQGLRRLSTFLHARPSKVHMEGFESKERKIFDPRDKGWQRWHSMFLFSCLAALFIDPLFFYLPVVNMDNVCLVIDKRLAIVVTILRTIIDLFHLAHIVVLFRTAFFLSSSSALTGGELVTDPAQIAKRYLSRNFILDLIAILPFPQIIIWVIIPAMQGTSADNTKNALRLTILIQLLPRIYPLTQQLGKSSSKVRTETAWEGAAYNLLLYMLISHFCGALFYLLAVEREDTCWREACQNGGCDTRYLDCSVKRPEGMSINSNVQSLCSSTQQGFFNFGIYNNALINGILSTNQFVGKYFYCLWFGLCNLSTLGQGLNTSSYDGELIFSICIVIVGLILLALLLGNMQTYLQSITLRLEEMRLKRRDMEQWMQHRQIYPELRTRIRSYEEYKWMETRGVNEEEVVKVLPKDLRRDIKRHLCWTLVKGVPLFSSMDDQLLDAICERLQPTLFTSGTTVVQEGEPVNEMLFIIRGRLKSVTTNGGRTGFLNEGKLDAGHFCGDELLTWALDPKSSSQFPSSTRSVTAEGEVEAFVLEAEDLKFVASQFRRLHSKQVQHTFRHYSQQWQTWAACSIQAAWRRYKTRKLEELRRKEEEESLQSVMQENRGTTGNVSLGAALFASRFATNAMRGVHRMRGLHAAGEGRTSFKLQKPAEPDFSAEDGE